MKAIFTATLVLAAGLLVANSRAATNNSTLSTNFNVSPGGDLAVEVDGGNLEVQTASQDQATIVVERTAGRAGDSDLAALLKHNHVKMTLDGNHVSVEIKSDPVSHGWFSSSRGQLQVLVRVTLPRRFNADLATGGGNIQVKDLQGMVNARSSGGNLDFARIEGVVDGSTSGGNMKAAGCSDKLTLQTSGGNVVVEDFTGPSAQIDTSGGNITVGNCAGLLQAKTSGGNISVENFSGTRTYLDTAGGTVSADLTKPPTGECWFRSSGGNITVKLPWDISASLHAATDGGQVSSELPVTVEGKMKEGRLEGKINGGGPNLILKTSGGDIHVLSR